MVVTVDRGRYTLLVEGRVVTAMKARPLGRRGVVVGDRVRVEGDVSGDEGSLARIVEVNERLTTLRRTAEDDDPVVCERAQGQTAELVGFGLLQGGGNRSQQQRDDGDDGEDNRGADELGGRADHRTDKGAGEGRSERDADRLAAPGRRTTEPRRNVRT